MAYRRTERVLQHLAARHDAIVAAARAIAAEQGLGAVQIVPGSSPMRRAPCASAGSPSR
jgi:hypothetical protein